MAITTFLYCTTPETDAILNWDCPGLFTTSIVNIRVITIWERIFRYSFFFTKFNYGYDKKDNILYFFNTPGNFLYLSKPQA